MLSLRISKEGTSEEKLMEKDPNKCGYLEKNILLLQVLRIQKKYGYLQLIDSAIDVTFKTILP